jgi:CheY-like chemotaxis protein
MSAKKTILIVEGSRTQAERLRLVLEAYNYAVVVATGGSEALAATRAQPPTLIISGVALAGTDGLDGYEMCAALKQDEELRHIPVVLLTALSDIEDLLRCLKSRVDYCIAKPYQEEELLTRIAAIIAGLVRTIGQAGREKLEVLLRGECEIISSDRQQLARLLLSTYENYGAVLRQNRSLSTTQHQLKTQNQHLQAECERLQTALRKGQETETATSPPSSPLRTGKNGNHADEEHLVLIAEDTLVGQTLLTRFLEKLGFQAEIVSNGVDAIEAYKKRRYAAVLMDVSLPIMDGLEAAKHIRHYEQTFGRQTPIIAVTAHTQPSDGERCLAVGMDEYLPKPVTLEALKRVLAPHLLRSSALSTKDVTETDASFTRTENL